MKPDFLSDPELENVEYLIQRIGDGNHLSRDAMRKGKESFPFIKKRLQEAETANADLQADNDDMKDLIKALWSLWESFAEAGELHIGKGFSSNFDRLEEQVKLFTDG